MELFRIVRSIYASNLVVPGVAGRWNRKGEYVLYTSASRSLATLELVVRNQQLHSEIDYCTMVVHASDDDRLVKRITISELSGYWRNVESYNVLQEIGSEWYQRKESLLLKVPSAIIPQEYNYLINTRHHLFPKHIRLVETEKYVLDSRLTL